VAWATRRVSESDSLLETLAAMPQVLEKATMTVVGP